MTIRIAILIVAVGLSHWPLSTSYAGPDWVEETDAGSFPGTSQSPKGTGPLSSIAGILSAASTANMDGRGGDLEDMYTIYIDDPVNFSAQTILTGSATFDSQLWLFDSHGRGVLANDDATIGLSGSRIAPPANDGTGQTIPGPGVYFLAITGYNNDPTNAFDALLFNQATRIEISGPDGSGGSFPIAQWRGSGESGSYVIRLNGAHFPPGDCDEDLVFDPDDNDIDGDGVPNASDTCDYTPLGAASLIVSDPAHPLYGSLACDMDGDCDCDLVDYAEFMRLFTGVGCANGEIVTKSVCPVVQDPTLQD